MLHINSVAYTLVIFSSSVLKRKMPVKINRCLFEIKYRRAPIVATLITFGFSSLWGSLLSGGRYFRGVATFGEHKSFTNRAGASLFSEIKSEQHKSIKFKKEQHSICIPYV